MCFAVPPVLTEVEKNNLLALLGLLTGIQGNLPADSGVKAAYDAATREIGLLLAQASE